MAGGKAVYEPGELDKVKQRLGGVDENEARRMQKLLGGEVGYEKTHSASSQDRSRGSSGTRVKAKGGGRIVDVAGEDEVSKRGRSYERRALTLSKIPYFERVKMDTCCAENQFAIKTPWQVFVSKISFFHSPADMVSPYFIRTMLNEYYEHIETLVTTVRLLLPKNNTDRAGKLKKISVTGFEILDEIRRWKVNQISAEIGKLQTRPRSVYVTDCQNLLREIYRPLYILEDLSVENDIEEAFNKLYKVLFLEKPTDETEKEKMKMRVAVASFKYIRHNIHHLLYPLMMKNIASEFCSYETFFAVNKERIEAFLNAGESDKIRPSHKNELDAILGEDETAEEETPPEEIKFETPEEIAAKEEEARLAAAETRAMENGLKTLDMLFPKAGWNALNTYPDFLPYFSGILSFRKGCELISPTDPVQLAFVLSAVIEEMLFGFRSIRFKGESESIVSVIEEWNYVFDATFYDGYIRLIDEYVGVLKSSGGNAKSNYAMSLANDIHWARRYYLFPLYEYKSGMPPTFSKKDIKAMFPLVRRLRNALTDIASEVEAVKREGGDATEASCPGIANPWENFAFEIANPISRRIEMLLPKSRRTNVNLIFFVLATVTVLDNHLSNPASIAYTEEHKQLFRSVNNEGREPILWVDKRADVDMIFSEYLAARKG